MSGRPSRKDLARLHEIIEQARSRSAIKRLGAWLDDEGEDLRPLLLAEGRSRGADLPDEAVRWPGKRLLRLALGREDEARKPGNPTRLDEPFTCVACGREVPPGSRLGRDHCPWCLRSLHVDVVPGDRASSCGGILDPVGVEVGGRPGMVIQYRCRKCGYVHRNRAMLDGSVPDDAAALRRLAAGGGPPSLPEPDGGRSPWSS
jgi:predicted RNA-binding Zn-ribbon protein involved in translation (DUF1610 family)